MPNMVLLHLLHSHITHTCVAHTFMFTMTPFHIHASLALPAMARGECEGSVARWKHCMHKHVVIFLVWILGPSPGSRVWVTD